MRSSLTLPVLALVLTLSAPVSGSAAEALATISGLQGKTLIFIAGDKEFSSSRPTVLLALELLF
jgi:hypothetical protein